jgi:hypothetical protein
MCVQIELEMGKTLNIQMMAKGEQRADGQREVFMELNGQSRSILVRDKAVSKVGAPVGRHTHAFIAGHERASQGVAGRQGFDRRPHAWTDTRNTREKGRHRQEEG